MESLIDRNSPLPLYHQIRERLLEELPQPGHQLPSEHELMARFGVSRMTVVQALRALENEGVVTRIQGKGTFVAPRKFQQRLAHLSGFTEDLKARGMRPETRLLSLNRVSAPSRVATDLGMEPGEAVWKVVRLRLADNEPIALQAAYLPERLCPEMRAEDMTGSLYTYVRERYGLVAVRARETYEASVFGNDMTARILGVQPGMPLLQALRVTFGAGGVAWEHVHSHIRGDRYSLQVELEGLQP